MYSLKYGPAHKPEHRRQRRALCQLRPKPSGLTLSLLFLFLLFSTRLHRLVSCVLLIPAAVSSVLLVPAVSSVLRIAIVRVRALLICVILHALHILILRIAILLIPGLRILAAAGRCTAFILTVTRARLNTVCPRRIASRILLLCRFLRVRCVAP